MSKYSNSKGRTGEREVADMICKAFECSSNDCYPTPHSGSSKRIAKDNPADIAMTPELRAQFPFCIEVKFQRDLPLHMLWDASETSRFSAMWKQVKRACMNSKLQPMVVMRRNRHPWLCMVPHLPVFSVWGGSCPHLLTCIEGDEVVVARFNRILLLYATIRSCLEDEENQDVFGPETV